MFKQMKQAMLLLDAQVALCICLTIILIFTNMLSAISKITSSKSNLDMLIGLYQLCDDLNVCYDLQVNDDEIIGYLDENKQIRINLHQSRLVKTPGFNIYLHELEEIYFMVKNNYLYLYLSKDGNDYEYKLIYAKRN